MYSSGERAGGKVGDFPGDVENERKEGRTAQQADTDNR